MTSQSGDVYTFHGKHPILQSPLTVEGYRSGLFLMDPIREMAELPLVLGSLLGVCSSHPSHPLSPAKSLGGKAELEFSEDRAPLVFEHSDLLIADDISCQV